MQFTTPDGQSERAGDALALRFHESGRPVRVTVNLTLGIRAAGTHWLDVVFDNRVLTRVPIRVQYQLVDESAPEEDAP